MPADPTITDVAVTAGAQGYMRFRKGPDAWNSMSDYSRGVARECTRAVLEAAVPHLFDWRAKAAEEANLIVEIQQKNRELEELRTAARQSADRDTETAALLRDAVAEIAELRANWVDDRVKRALKGWRESSWTSAEADRIEQEAIQKWNTNHPALIALWRHHEQARVAAKNETAALRDAVQMVKNCIGHPDTGLTPHSDQIAALRDRLDFIRNLVAKYYHRDDVLPADLVDEVHALTDTASLGGGK